MRALTYENYGSPQVVEITQEPVPFPEEGQVQVRVQASAVNTSDWRIRAAAFPGILAIPGRLMFGIFAPRNKMLGSEFAGIVETTGEGISRFSVGDRVYGFTDKGGASAEFLTIGETSAIAAMPTSLGFAEAAALPFGALCALSFLSDIAAIKPTQKLLVVGGSGGVGTYAVQIGKALGAHVTAVAGTENQDYLLALGADETVDYKTTNVAAWPTGFDVVFDTVGGLRPAQALSLLAEDGKFFPLNFGLPELGAALLNPFRRRKTVLAVNQDTAEGLERLNSLIERGLLRPVVENAFTLAQAVEAHQLVETRHRRGSVVLTLQS